MDHVCRLVVLFGVAALMSGCATTPPERQDNICEIFDQHPGWYDHARESERRWGISIPIQMAIVQRESSFRARVRPERTKLLGFIPWTRPSSALGYAQAQDPAWDEYLALTGRSDWFASRTDMADALDFIGWYNYTSHRRLGIARDDAYRLYLAYHEGRTGYRNESWRDKPAVQRAARQVADRASRYATQLERCRDRFHCDAWWEFWPICR